MAHLLLKTRLAMELPRINAALSRAEQALPLPVQPIAHHIFAAGGKRLRPLLLVLTAKMFNAKSEQLYDLAVTLEMLHAATLLHDDVIDEAPLRRGQPAAHTIFGITPTILAGDALLASGNALVASFNIPALSLAYSKATAETCAGEINEIHQQFKPELSLEEYLLIIKGKTARLISTSCAMGAIFAEAKESEILALTKFGEMIGLAFQLVDDALDFAKSSATGKPSLGDLKEGKLTMPLRYYREALPLEERKDFDGRFAKGSFSEEDCELLAQKIIEKGYAEQTRAYADTYLNQALQALSPLPPSGEKDLLLEMTSFVRERTK